MKKNLVINTATCDARAVSEQTLGAYENITVNAACVITTAESRELLHRYNVSLNCSDVIDVPHDAEVITHNGSYTIAASDPADGKPAVLMVNGRLVIEPGAQEALRRYVSIHVNGSVSYPNTLSSLLGSMSVNGSTDSYPGDATLLKSTVVLDRAFVVRAKGGRYYARKRVVILDGSFDLASLSAKNTLFLTKTAIVADSLLEAAAPLFSEDTEMIVVPDGCAFISDSVELNRPLLRKNGGKLFISGDLTLDKDAGELFDKVEYLRVTGSVMLPAALEESFCAINAEYGELHVVKGKIINDKISVKVDSRLLDRNPDGVTVRDCVNVSIAPDVTPELIVERLELKDCVAVACSPEQRSAIDQIATDIASIDDSGEGGSLASGIGKLLGKELSDKDTEVNNSASYRF